MTSISPDDGTSRLIIRYRTYEGIETERTVSDIRFEPPKSMNAHCYLRNERRSFVISRIVYAIDAQTGEIVDMAARFGLTVPAPSKPQSFLRSAAEMQCLRRGSAEYHRERQKEKRALMKPFRLEVIYEHYRDQLFSQFSHQCAKCHGHARLEMDHHIPLLLGGRLIPGNIVALCSRCNNSKGDRPPQAFYTVQELGSIELILDQQRALPTFKFDSDHWDRDRKGYLISLGIEPSLVDAVLSDPHHRWYAGYSKEIGVRFEVLGIDELINGTSTTPTLQTRPLKEG